MLFHYLRIRFWTIFLLFHPYCGQTLPLEIMIRTNLDLNYLRMLTHFSSLWMSLMAEATNSSPSSLSSNPQSTRPPIQQTPAGNPEFVTVDDKYRCVVCTGIVREAVQTRCGHRGCEQCFSQLLEGNPKQIMCPAGEESCVYLKVNEVTI